MNIAIWVTTTLIMAEEAGVELKVVQDRLRCRPDKAVGDELRALLREYKSAIIERLKYDAANPSAFKDFCDRCCLFYRGDGLVTPKEEIAQAYQLWAQQYHQPVLSTTLLSKRLRELGYEEVTFQNVPCWEHIGVHWPVLASAPAGAEVLGRPSAVRQSSLTNGEFPAAPSPATGPEPVNPYSQTTCLDCGGSGIGLQTVYAVGTLWPFKLCSGCYTQRYGVHRFTWARLFREDAK